MEKAFFGIVFLLILLESALYGPYPYFAIAISFMGYITYKKGVYALFFTLPTIILLGLSGSSLHYDIIFCLAFTIIFYNLFRNIMFNKVNVLLITFIEVLMYVAYIYFFKIREALPMSWIKEFIFVFFYNMIFCWFEEHNRI